MILHLNDGKVAKFFGPHPERGRVLPGAPKKRVTVGVRWSLPKMDYVPDDDVLVAPTVALKCLGRGKWEVKADREHLQRAVDWLVDRCM